jgi:hypothetical protein
MNVNVTVDYLNLSLQQQKTTPISKPSVGESQHNKWDGRRVLVNIGSNIRVIVV